MSKSVLSVKDYGVAHGDKTILSSVTFEIPEKGILNLLGPAGTGKSTLIRTLSGVNDSNPAIRSWGEVNYLGEPLGEAGYPQMVVQNEKLMALSVFENIISDYMEKKKHKMSIKYDTACRLLKDVGLRDLVDRLDVNVVDLPLETIRHLEIARVCAANPPVIFIDEPTHGIEDERTLSLLNYMKEESKKRAVVIVMNNQLQAKLLGGQSILLAGGEIKECSTTKEFFLSPKSNSTIEFIKDGTCKEANQENESEISGSDNLVNGDLKLAEFIEYEGEDSGPTGFFWFKENKLAGTPKPGSLGNLGKDLEALQRLGITHLISLTAEMDPIDEYELANFFISSSWMPFENMEAPSMDQAIQLCEDIDRLSSENCAVAVHSKEGLGRTGTVFAFYLIWEGKTALEALESVRKIEPQWVQSDKQIRFLEEFENDLTNRNFLALAINK